MRKFWTAIALVLAACSSGEDQPLVPADADVARLETALARHPCVGTLQEWERNYRLGFRPKALWPGTFEPAFDVIQFHYRHTGPISIVSARNIVRIGADEEWPDSPAVRTVSGRFNVKSGRLNVDRCEPAPPAP